MAIFPTFPVWPLAINQNSRTSHFALFPFSVFSDHFFFLGFSDEGDYDLHPLDDTAQGKLKMFLCNSNPLYLEGPIDWAMSPHVCLLLDWTSFWEWRSRSPVTRPDPGAEKLSALAKCSLSLPTSHHGHQTINDCQPFSRNITTRGPSLNGVQSRFLSA